MGIIKHEWKTLKYKNLEVYYLQNLIGGGETFGQDYIPVVKQEFGSVNTLCEFACGPGYIGFSLLAHGLCKKLILIDINPLAIEACQKTIKENGLKNVTTYLSDGLSKIPSNEKWNLVVSNPPHFNGNFEGRKDLLLIDPDWKIHKNFYSKVANHLTKDGSILFIENVSGSDEKLWKEMIEKNGLLFIKTFQYNHGLIKVMKENLRNLLSSDFAKYKRLLIYLFSKKKKILINLSQLAAINKYQYFFVWSKNK